jgi:hypothetical protein
LAEGSGDEEVAERCVLFFPFVKVRDVTGSGLGLDEVDLRFFSGDVFQVFQPWDVMRWGEVLKISDF